VCAEAASDPAGAAVKALDTGPVLLSEADGKKLLFQELKSGKDLIQTPFGNLPQISEKVGRLCGVSEQAVWMLLYSKVRSVVKGEGAVTHQQLLFQELKYGKDFIQMLS
jgi:hypothetical protein